MVLIHGLNYFYFVKWWSSELIWVVVKKIKSSLYGWFLSSANLERKYHYSIISNLKCETVYHQRKDSTAIFIVLINHATVGSAFWPNLCCILLCRFLWSLVNSGSRILIKTKLITVYNAVHHFDVDCDICNNESVKYSTVILIQLELSLLNRTH